MTTITTPLRRSPRSLRTPSAPASARARRVLRHLHWIGESLDSDQRAPLCHVTLRGYSEARSAR